MGGHGVMKTLAGSLALVGATFDPVDGQRDARASNHGQIQGGGGMAHSAAVFPGGDIQSQVQSIFNPPVAAIRLAEGLGRQAPGANELFGLQALSLGSGSVHEARQAGGLFHCGKAGLFGRGWKTHQTTSFHASAIALDALNQVLLSRREKKRSARSLAVVVP
jgi:hypothetical protein